ncbi:MAG TPA: hypothetical protein VM509_14515, partial [Planctomycetota bacterium]|nr:hypothetical protein [Planctomycetota bacterium]
MNLPSPRIVSSLAFLAAAFFAGWLWLGPGASGEWSDGHGAVVADRGLRIATWGDPERAWDDLPEAADSRVAFSSDGRWIVWAAKDAPGGHDLCAGELRDGRIVSSAPIAELATEADECAPAFQGEWLYFSSDRPGGAGAHDLWRARFADGAVVSPELVPGPANTAGEELDPAPLSDGSALVFVADRDGAGMDLYAAPLAEGVATRLDVLCTEGDEREPALTQADRALVFASSRGGGLGGFDLYRAARFGERYGAPEPLDRLNSIQDERAPLAASDDLGLRFLRLEDGAHPAFFASPAVELFRTPRRPVDWMEWAALAGLLALALLALLVQRFPELDRIYKCLLASVVLHLFLLWWFHDIWLPSGSAPEPEPSRAPVQIRLHEPMPEEVLPEEPLVERANEPEPEPVVASAATVAAPAPELGLPEAPSATGTDAAPERLELSAERSEPAPAEASVASAAPEAANLPTRETS